MRENLRICSATGRWCSSICARLSSGKRCEAALVHEMVAMPPSQPAVTAMPMVSAFAVFIFPSPSRVVSLARPPPTRQAASCRKAAGQGTPKARCWPEKGTDMSAEEAMEAAPHAGRLKFFDQPRGVLLIASTEFWERFSYYGFIGLIALFMAADPATGGLGMEKGATLKLFGITVGMMFMAPLLGGWIADRFTGPYRAVVIGCLGLAAANFLL